MSLHELSPSSESRAGHSRSGEDKGSQGTGFPFAIVDCEDGPGRENEHGELVSTPCERERNSVELILNLIPNPFRMCSN